MPDLTPVELEQELSSVEKTLNHARAIDKPFISFSVRLMGSLISSLHQLQREKQGAFAIGRKQGWQDAGLSLDAQEVLAASFTTSSDV